MEGWAMVLFDWSVVWSGRKKEMLLPRCFASPPLDSLDATSLSLGSKLLDE